VKDSSLYPPGPSGRIPGRAADAVAKLKAELAGNPQIRVETGQADTFEAMRVTGPEESVLVSVHEIDEDRVVYLWPAQHAEYCEILGTPKQITMVAGLIRRRVGVTS
jgi:hypothetical protein